MPRRRASIAPRTPLQEVIDQQIAQGAEISKVKQPGPSALQAGDFEKYEAPVPWEMLVHHPGSHSPAILEDGVVYYHPGQGETDTHEAVPAGWKSLSGRAGFEILVTDPESSVVVKNGAAYMYIPEDVGGKRLAQVSAALVVAGSSTTSVQFRDVTGTPFDYLSTNITLPAGTRYSTNGVINEANATVNAGQIIAIDVENAGSGAKGLMVSLLFA
jgi:hypothetical protein